MAILLALGTSRPEAFVPSSGTVASLAATCSNPVARCRSRRAGVRSRPSMSTSDEHDILLRVAKGEKADRAPVWLMRQVSVGCHLLVPQNLPTAVPSCHVTRAPRGNRVDYTGAEQAPPLASPSESSLYRTNLEEGSPIQCRHGTTSSWDLHAAGCVHTAVPLVHVSETRASMQRVSIDTLLSRWHVLYRCLRLLL